MTRKQKLIVGISYALLALLLLLTLAVPDHRNGNGWEYGLWCSFTLYPLLYIATGVFTGFFLNAKGLLFPGFLVLYALSFGVFLLNWLREGGGLPNLLPFAVACLFYPFAATAASAVVVVISAFVRDYLQFRKAQEDRQK